MDLDVRKNETSWNESDTEVTNNIINGTNDRTPATVPFLFYFSLFTIFTPGFITNVLALGFIIKDVQKAVFPAIVLLLALIGADLAAVVFITVYLTIGQFGIEVTYSLCAVLSVLNTFFRMYSGILNVLMCTDRVLAICTPYFYKRNILVSTWNLGIIVGGVCTLIFAMFPVVGLGDVVRTVYINGNPVLKCSTLHYRQELHKKVTGILYGIFGLLIIIYIVVGNCMVIRAAFNMRRKVVSVNPESSVTMEPECNNKASMPSFEIAFAKLMGGLATVYLVSGAPYSISVVLEQISPVSSGIKGIIHFLAGMSYSVDPVVYILIRKTTRRKMCNFLRCRCTKNDFSN